MRYNVILLLLLSYILKTTQVWTNILMIGDSNDRNLLISICDLYRGNGTNFGNEDFVSQNGVTSKSWCSKDHHFFYHGLNGFTSFSKDTIKNWSDLQCDINQLNITLFSLQIFGAADEPPYYLRLCSNGIANDGPYCGTKSRVARGIELIHQDKKIDYIMFQSIGWDISYQPHISKVDDNMIINYRNRINQLLEIAPESHIILRTQPVGSEYKMKAKIDEYNQKVVKKVALEYKSAKIYLFDLLLLDTRNWFVPNDHFHFTDVFLHHIFDIMIISLDTIKQNNKTMV